MKIIIHWYWWLIPLVLIWLFIGRTTISFKPFKIHLDAPELMIGVILCSMGMVLIMYHVNKAAEKRVMDAIEQIIEKQNEST